jgi:NADPH-dependent 2,4-dienoyl-CoA reductase/sulfur reductase-like enzyme
MAKPSTLLPETCTVAVVGGGSAGLALAAEIKRQGAYDVHVLERELDAGGIPRHCGHYPFGIREYGRLLKGPEYALRNVNAARDLGVEIHTGITVTALHPNGKLSLATTAGPFDLQAVRVVLCTGVRESSRAQRFIGGSRPLGVISTGALQSLVYLQGIRPFRHPVILGSELISFSAVETCRHLGIQPTAMVEEQTRIIARKLLRPYLLLRGVSFYAGVKSVRVIGRERVEALEFTNSSNQLQQIETDGVIVSGRFRPEAALLHQSHLEVDPGTGGPVVDQYGQCSDPTYYCAGNLLRPAETSSWCWYEGVETARRVACDLSGPDTPIKRSVRLSPADPRIEFVVPQRLSASSRSGAMSKMQIGLSAPARGILEAISDGRCIWQSPISSRPVRRIAMPLNGILESQSNSNVELKIR